MNHFETARKAALYLNLDELLELNRHVVQYIKNERAEKVRSLKSKLFVGATVKFEDNDGREVTGDIAKIMRKYAQVKEGRSTWRVPIAQLAQAPSQTQAKP